MSHLSYLFSLQQTGIKLGLDQIRALDALIDHPSRSFRSIIVAGTNGKGSVAAMVERGLRDSGFRTGRFTSPHLSRLEERFAIDGLPIGPVPLEESAGRVREAAERMNAPPSFFEATTAIAFDLFRDADVDVAVLEVGLGGRLDATNIADAEAAVITQIDFDHEAWLGNTIEQIAAEKAGVIKRGALVTLAENAAAVRNVVSHAAQEKAATLVYAPEGVTLRDVALEMGRVRCTVSTPRRTYASLTFALRGRHQLTNGVTSIRALEELDARGQFHIGPGSIRSAVEGAAWPGRLELIAWRQGEVLIDGAHNPAGARALADYLAEVYGHPLPLVVAVMSDKRVDEILCTLAPVASHFVFTAPPVARAATPEELQRRAAAIAPRVPSLAVADPMSALERASTFGTPVVVAGSLYLAGEIRDRIT